MEPSRPAQPDRRINALQGTKQRDYDLIDSISAIYLITRLNVTHY